MSKVIKARKWIVVINNPSDNEIKAFEDLNYDYKIYEIEHENEGTKHLQGFIENRTQIRFNVLKKKLPRAHLEVAYGSTEKNIEYCSKEGKAKEFGNKKPSKTFDIESIENTLEQGEEKVDELDKLIKNIKAKNYFIGLQLLLEMQQEILDGDLKKPEVIYIYGSSGSGKSYYAWNYALNKFGKGNVSDITFANNFAICSEPHSPCLIFDEFRPSQLDAATFLKLIDGYGTNLNIKHSQVYIRPKCIIITSIKNPVEIYKEEINVQFTRRISRFINKDEDPYEKRPREEEPQFRCEDNGRCPPHLVSLSE